VPPIYDRIAAAAAERGIALEGIRFSISGAMNLPTATVETWEKATGGYLIEGYGLTETSPIALGNPFGPSRKPGTVGVPFPLTDIRVVDPRNVLLDRAPGEEGELLIRGPQVFAGYWNRPQETEEALLEGGWFRTGDIVSVDKDYFVTVRDRIKELIITGGFNVSPTEVEDVLSEYPGVLEVCVVGLPRPGGGEDVVAAVVPAAGSGAEVDPESLLAFARQNLAAYKVPRRVTVVDELPRSLIGKVLRREVRNSLAAGS
jgi:long-chain acyl-CoA synthetase